MANHEDEKRVDAPAPEAPLALPSEGRALRLGEAPRVANRSNQPAHKCVRITLSPAERRRFRSSAGEDPAYRSNDGSISMRSVAGSSRLCNGSG